MPRRTLKTPSDVRRYLSALMFKIEGGEVEPSKGTKLGFLANVLLKALELEQIEARLDQLEKLITRKLPA